MWNNNIGRGVPYSRYPAELREIAEIIASGKPNINMDDICDCLIELWESEKNNKNTNQDRVEGLRYKQRRLVHS